MKRRFPLGVVVGLTACLAAACGGTTRNPDMGSIDWGRAIGGRGEDRIWDAWAGGRGGALWRDMQSCFTLSERWWGPIEFSGAGGAPWNCRFDAASDPRLSLLIARLGDEALDLETHFYGASNAAVLGRFGPTPTSRLAIRWAERAAPSVTDGESYLARSWKKRGTHAPTDAPTEWPVGAVGPAEGLVVVLLLLELGDGRQAERWLRGAPNTPVVELLRAQAASLDTTRPADQRRERLRLAWHGVRMLMPARARFELAHLALAAGALDEAAAQLAHLTAEAEPVPPVVLPSNVLLYPPMSSARPRKASPEVQDLASRIEAARRSAPSASDPSAQERVPDPAKSEAGSEGRGRP